MYKFSSIIALILLLIGASWFAHKSDDLKITGANIVVLQGLKLEFLNYPVQIEQETHFVIHFNDPSEYQRIDHITAKIEGLNMFMGVMPVFMEEAKTNSGEWPGSFFLGSCSEPQMAWRMFIEVTYKNGEKANHSVDFSTTL